MQSPGSQFISQIELVMVRTVGQIVGKSLVQNQLKKLQKERDALSAEDCVIVGKNVVNALSLFVTKQEAETAKAAVDKLVSTYC